MSQTSRPVTRLIPRAGQLGHFVEVDAAEPAQLILAVRRDSDRPSGSDPCDPAAAEELVTKRRAYHATEVRFALGPVQARADQRAAAGGEDGNVNVELRMQPR